MPGPGSLEATGRAVAVDPTNTNVLYAEYYGLSIQKSTGGAFFPATTGIKSDDGFLFIVPFTMDPTTPSRLGTGGSFVWRTTNGAASWSRASASLGQSVSAIAVSPIDGNHVLVGGNNGAIYRNAKALSAKSGTTWAHVTPAKRLRFVDRLRSERRHEGVRDLLHLRRPTRLGHGRRRGFVVEHRRGPARRPGALHRGGRPRPPLPGYGPGRLHLGRRRRQLVRGEHGVREHQHRFAGPRGHRSLRLHPRPRGVAGRPGRAPPAGHLRRGRLGGRREQGHDQRSVLRIPRRSLRLSHDGPLRHGGRDGSGRLGLYGCLRSPHICSRVDGRHSVRPRQGRHIDRDRRDLHRPAQQPGQRDPRRCDGHGHDHERRHGGDLLLQCAQLRGERVPDLRDDPPSGAAAAPPVPRRWSIPPASGYRDPALGLHVDVGDPHLRRAGGRAVVPDGADHTRYGPRTDRDVRRPPCATGWLRRHRGFRH